MKILRSSKHTRRNRLSRASRHKLALSIDSHGSNIIGETAEKSYDIGDDRAFTNKEGGLLSRLLKRPEALSYMPSLYYSLV